MKTIFRLLLRLLFGYRTFNDAVLKAKGPVLLLPNHASWLDWLFLWCVLDDDWKFVTSSATAETTWLHRAIMINRYTFPIDTASPYAVKRMAEFLQGGGRLVLFSEGRISLTGTLMKLFDGTGFLLFKTHAKVITCYLRGAKRLPFSPNPDKKLLLSRVTGHFSPLLNPPEVHGMSTAHARDTLTAWLRARLLEQQFAVEMEYGPRDLLSAISHMASILPGKIVLEDALGGELSYRKLLLGGGLLGEQFQAVLGRGEQRVGVLLPNINATPVVLLALWKIGRI